MNVSLYELVQSAPQPAQTLLVSPTTFLAMVRSVIDLLIDQQIAATMWVKLPPGKIWYSEIQRYQNQVGVSHAIYICNPDSDGSEAKVDRVGSSPTDSSGLTAQPKSLVTTVHLPSTSPIERREYFVLVLSSQFCYLILAHKLRVKRQTELEEQGTSKTTQQLQTMSSFEEPVIQQVLNGIKQAILANESNNEEDTPHNALLLNWDSLFSSGCVTSPDLIAQLLTRQIQRQDEIVRNTNLESPTAALQAENEVLLTTIRRKDELLNNMCHELRTPLTHMKTALSLLNSSQLKPSQRQRYLQILSTECDRQNSLIGGMLDLVQLDLGGEEKALGPVRLSDIVPGVVSTYQPLAQEKGIMLAYTVPTELPAISCVSSWLKQIIINLLHNSIKFTPAGGQVWVRSSLQGDYVQLEFRDTGIGIPSNDIPKIFDRFYRVRPVAGEDTGGAGLGLTIVQQLLLRCGGSISVKSRLGEGSVFTVLFVILTPESDSILS